MKKFNASQSALLLSSVFVYPVIVEVIYMRVTSNMGDLYRYMGFIYTNIAVSLAALFISLATIYYAQRRKEGSIKAADKYAGVAISTTFFIVSILLYVTMSKGRSGSSVMVFAMPPLLWSLWYFVSMCRLKVMSNE